MWTLLDAERHTGVSLTENYAMNPGSSVSGFYFSHKQSRYFNVGELAEDQLKNYAARKGLSVDKLKKWI